MGDWIDRTIGGVWLTVLSVALGVGWRERVSKDVCAAVHASISRDLAEVKDDQRRIFKSIEELRVDLARIPRCGGGD